jgi:hypothetical protein
VELTACEPPLAGAEEGPPSALGPIGENVTPTRAIVPTPVPWESRLAMLRKNSVK